MAETTYDACLELAPDGACLAQILDLPGCFAIGPDESTALAALAAAITGYFAWLQTHDEYTPVVPGPFAVAARERATGVAQPCGALGFFAPDAEPVTGDDLDWLLALLGWAIGDLLSAPAPRGDVLVHIAEAQWQALTPLAAASQGSPAFLSAEGPSALTGLQVWTDSLLRAASEDDLARVEEHDGHRWSPRWTLRRAIVHARWHAQPQGWHPIWPGGVP
jgi:predicted RNase H-like HicB family nuclease